MAISTMRNPYFKCLTALTTAALLLATGIIQAAEDTKVTRLSEPVAQTADSETFGALLDESVPMVTLEKLAIGGGDYVGQPVRVIARVSEVCQKKGCFFIAQEGSSVMRISFKDYGFFVPTDISGKRVTFTGEVVAREITGDEAAHYTADLGTADSPVKPGKVYEFVATSVRVPRG